MSVVELKGHAPMRYILLLPITLFGLAGCVVSTPAPAPVSTTYVTPAPATTYVAPAPATTYVTPVAPPATTTVIRSP
jgi:hypothetical protein